MSGWNDRKENDVHGLSMRGDDGVKVPAGDELGRLGESADQGRREREVRSVERIRSLKKPKGG
jgi:hypothetical protein